MGCMTLSGFLFWFVVFKQKTAYEMRISDWSSDVCSSDLQHLVIGIEILQEQRAAAPDQSGEAGDGGIDAAQQRLAGFAALSRRLQAAHQDVERAGGMQGEPGPDPQRRRSEEHTSELQSLMRITYAVFCVQKKKQQNIT